jgi:protein phosphatase
MTTDTPDEERRKQVSTLSDTEEAPAPARPPGWDRPPLLSALARVDAAGLTHQGLVRANNEDHFYVVRFGRYLERLFTNLPEEEMPRRLEETGYGLVVADGVGGREAGEVASRLAINSLVNLVLLTPDWILRRDDATLNEELRRRAAERFAQVNVVLDEQAQADPTLGRFATTLTVAASLGTHLLVTHLGDSRAYLLRGERLFQLTRDHTLAQDLVDSGRLGRSEIATHPWRHVLTRALGGGSTADEPDLDEFTLADGDALLLCSDGLTDMVKDDRIAEILRGAPTAELACQALVEAALQAGGKDNVTVVVARYQFPPAPETGASR